MNIEWIILTRATLALLAAASAGIYTIIHIYDNCIRFRFILHQLPASLGGGVLISRLNKLGSPGGLGLQTGEALLALRLPWQRLAPSASYFCFSANCFWLLHFHSKGSRSKSRRMSRIGSRRSIRRRRGISLPMREPVMVWGIGRVLPWVPGTGRSKRIRNHQRSSSSARGQSIHTQGGRGRGRLPGGCGGLVEDRLPLYKQSPWCSSPSASPSSSSNTDAAPWNCDSTRQRGPPSPQR